MRGNYFVYAHIFVKQSLLFFNSITGAEKFGKIYLKKQSP